MPKVSLAEMALEWERLLSGADEDRESQEPLREYVERLRELLARLRQLETLRARLKAQRQEATQELDGVRSEGKDLAIQIRLYYKSQLGLRDERLSRYGIRPRRRYAPRTRPTAPRTRKSTGR